MMMIDNVINTLRDDLAVTIKDGSRISIAAACFSIYAYQELKEQLEGIDELRFIFTSQTFTKEKAPREKREFYIPRRDRERSLCGTEFELRLRNRLEQKAIARECAEWIRRKVRFRSIVSGENMQSFTDVRGADGGEAVYFPVTDFTTAGIGCERGNSISNVVHRFDEAPICRQYLSIFDSVWSDSSRLQDVTEQVLESITAAYRENAPEYIYFTALYNIFSEFLEDVSEDELPNDATGFRDSRIWNMLYNFQRDAALAAINKLERYNGCILADSVGLGKTFTALAVIKYYENRNKNVLVLCPKKLGDNWHMFRENYINNPIAADRLRYDVLYHTDLSRERGSSNGLDLSRVNWGNYDLVVIDESHNFRNGGDYSGSDEDRRENRYLRLLNRVIRTGVRTRVLMLSATPVNNRFYDLRNQLQLACEGRTDVINEKLNTSKPVDLIFSSAQKAFNAWSKYEPSERTTESLLRMLSFDFFELLDSITIARSRRHIQKYYDTSSIGAFPQRMKPITLRPSITDLDVSYNDIFERLMSLNLSIYTPTKYVFPSRLGKYVDTSTNIDRAGREAGIRRLMSINLLKRLESSVHAFRLTVSRISALIASAVRDIDDHKTSVELADISGIADDLDGDDSGAEILSFSERISISLDDIDCVVWRRDLASDLEILNELSDIVRTVTPEHDTKLQTLLHDVVAGKIGHTINDGNKKLLIFTAFADTAEYLYDNVSRFVKSRFGLDTAMVTGSVDGRSTVKGLRADLNTILTCFSPISKDRDLLMPKGAHDIDVLIATDCISEGQNLQDCDCCVNYDIHWNPVRIIQRFGRIDRIGSRNSVIQLVNFWPDMSLDEYINLKARVETRMRISVMSSSGDDDPINTDERGDLEYRREQLKRLQEEITDIEDMDTGIAITDLGLNEFRLDLLEYMKRHDDIESAPHGMNAVVSSGGNDAPPGVIYVLRNVNNGVNIDEQNRLHPFYMVYVSDDGGIVIDHLSPKKLLDTMRLLCRGKTEPNKTLCAAVNRETKDGRDMRRYSKLLSEAIASVISLKEERDIDSLFSAGGTTALLSEIKGLDDFELICFIIVR